jgi:GT2 family glycosyltransferase
MCTLFKREVLLANPFDERFVSGEDIELRWRLKQAGLKIGVSNRTTVQHRFDDNYEFARDQFLADGKGIGRVVSKYGWRAGLLLAIPTAGAVRGILLSLLHFEPKWIPYYLAYFVFNYAAMPGGLRERLSQPSRA